MIVAINKGPRSARSSAWPTTAWRPTCSRLCLELVKACKTGSRAPASSVGGFFHRRGCFILWSAKGIDSVFFHGTLRLHRPLKDMLFVHQAPAWPTSTSGAAAQFEDAGADTAGRAGRVRQVQPGCGGAAELGRRQRGGWKDTVVTTTPGFKEAFASLQKAAGRAYSIRRTLAARACPKPSGTACGECSTAPTCLCPVPAADRRCHRGAADRRLRRTESHLPGKTGERQVDRHHEPDRTAGGFRPGSGAHRAEPQPDGTYKIFGTKIFITYGEHDMADNIVHLVLARARRARRREGHQPVRGAQVHGGLRRCPGCPQRRVLREHRAQNGHQGQPHGGAAIR